MSNGVELTGPAGTGLKAYGPGALWLIGFLIIAAAVVLNGYLARDDLRREGTLYREAIAAQTKLFQGKVDHIELELRDLRDELLRSRVERFYPEPTPRPVPR